MTNERKNYYADLLYHAGMDEILTILNDFEKEVKTGKIKKDKDFDKNKPKFPISFKGKQLNNLLYEVDDSCKIDKEFVEFIKEEDDLDISALLNWEINTSHVGFHHHDGQVCDYTVEFISPEGYSYKTYESHSLVTGWNFYTDSIIPE